jgi:hypothetical protein
MLKPEEFTAKTQEVLQNLTDQAKVSEILAELLNDHADTVKQFTEGQKLVTSTTEANEKLRQANMKLFLQIGDKPDMSQIDKAKQQAGQEDKPAKVEDFLDAKGNLK